MSHHSANMEYDLKAHRQLQADMSHASRGRFVDADKMIYRIKKSEWEANGPTRKHLHDADFVRLGHSVLTPELLPDRSLD
jgi:hypothetical protein